MPFAGIGRAIKGECAWALVRRSVCRDAGGYMAHGGCPGAQSWFRAGMCNRLASKWFRFELRVGSLCRTAIGGQAELSYLSKGDHPRHFVGDFSFCWLDKTAKNPNRRTKLSNSMRRAKVTNLVPLRALAVAYGHTTLKTPVLVRSLKLSNVGPG